MTQTVLLPSRVRDVFGRLKISQTQNIYDADFEYGPQPLRWEAFTANGGATVHQAGQGGVRLSVTTAANSIAIRQSRPYHRYQPGKSMYMASAVLTDPAVANNRQRVGFFDDGNGVFFEQANPTPTNPSGMFVVIRSDVNGAPQDNRISLENWNGDKSIIQSLQWDRIQMVWIEYAWYGAGTVRWGVLLDGEPHILHNFGVGNRESQTIPWCRTGNLPVRYETRNIAATTAASNMLHYGVSVIVEGRVDDQRGFTYSYGMQLGSPRRSVSANTTRFPLLSIRMRAMGAQEFTQANAACTAGSSTSLTAGTATWSVNQWAGRGLSYVVSNVTYTARVVSNTATVLTIADVITGLPVAIAPTAGGSYTIGLINRGQILPRRLLISSSALAQCELISSTPTSPISLTGASFQAASTLGAANSFAERDVNATAMSGGEVVMKFTLPAGGSGLQDIDLSNLFPLYTNVGGNVPDILTLAISTAAATPADVGADFNCQEAMS
jgi:hypothetical protein